MVRLATATQAGQMKTGKQLTIKYRITKRLFVWTASVHRLPVRLCQSLERRAVHTKGRFYLQRVGIMNQLSKEYLDYIKSKTWKKKRQKRLDIDNHTCQDCGVASQSLDVHHKTYKRFKRERMSDLVSLCRDCHKLRHNKKPYIISSVCQTCGRFLLMLVKKVRIMGQSWTDYTCEDGHVRSYRDD